MPNIDLSRLERLSYGNRLSEKRPITEERLGQLITAMWQVLNEDNADFPAREQLQDALLGTDERPEAVSRLFSIEHRVDGPMLETLTGIINSAQQSLMASRLNPEHDGLNATLTPPESRQVLQHYKSEFPEEFRWIKAVIAAIRTGHSAEYS